MKRVAIISDIHGNIEALDAVLEHIKNQNCDQIFCTGDLVGYGPHPNEVIEKIKKLRIPTVMGNYDEAVGFLLPACGCHNSDANTKRYATNSLKWSITHTTPKNREFLRELPEQLEVEVGNKRMLLIHATPDSMSEYIYEKDSERLIDLLDYIAQDIYVYGHTHFPYRMTLPDKDKIVINAGSVGRPKDGDNRATYIVLDVEENSICSMIHKVPYDVDKVVKEIEESRLDNYFAKFLKSGGTCVGKCKCN